MVKAGLAASNGEARRRVVQGGVLADGEKVAAPTVSFTAEQLAKGIVINNRPQPPEPGQLVLSAQTMSLLLTPFRKKILGSVFYHRTSLSCASGAVAV